MASLASHILNFLILIFHNLAGQIFGKPSLVFRNLGQLLEEILSYKNYWVYAKFDV